MASKSLPLLTPGRDPSPCGRNRLFGLKFFQDQRLDPNGIVLRQRVAVGGRRSERIGVFFCWDCQFLGFRPRSERDGGLKKL